MCSHVKPKQSPINNIRAKNKGNSESNKNKFCPKTKKNTVAFLSYNNTVSMS